MYRALSFVLLTLYFLAHASGSSLYGITNRRYSTSNVVTTSLVTVNPSNGSFTPIVDTFQSLGIIEIMPYTGINGLNQNRGIFYYADNVYSSYIYSIDLNTGRILPPISTEATFTALIVPNLSNDELLVTALYTQDMVVLSIPYDPSQAPQILLNFTAMNVSQENVISAAAIDPSTGTYYFVYQVGNETLNLGQISTTTPDAVTIQAFPCDNIVPLTLHYDTKRGQLIGTAMDFDITNNYIFTIANGQCTVSELYILSGGGVSFFRIIPTSTFDTANNLLYFPLDDSNYDYLWTYDLTTQNGSSVIIPNDLSNIVIY